MSTLDKTWHLAASEAEIKVTDFELQLWRVFYGFLRWQEECESSINGTDLTGNELAILHVIRMKDKPKTIYDIARLLNRNDNFNINYSIRKLLKMGLIEKVRVTQASKKVSGFYQVTEVGIHNTDAYTEARKHILIAMFNQTSELNLDDIAKMLAKIKAIYDEADRTVTAYAKPRADTAPLKKIKNIDVSNDADEISEVQIIKKSKKPLKKSGKKS